MKKCKYYQQGDVIIKQVSIIPLDLIEVKEHKILQYGETTGHAHKFDLKSNLHLFIDPLFKDDSKRITPLHRKFLQINEPCELKHEEHNTIIIDTGLYEIDIVREYDYEKDEIVRVVD